MSDQNDPARVESEWAPPGSGGVDPATEVPAVGVPAPGVEAPVSGGIYLDAETQFTPDIEPDVLNEFAADYTPPSPEIAAPVQPVAVPPETDRRKLPSGDYHYLKRWTFVLVIAAVWVPAAVGGGALYYWWFHSLDKTLPLFVAVLAVFGCALIGLLLSMVEDKPLVTALSLAIMSALLAATAGAALLHGAYYFQWIDRPG